MNSFPLISVLALIVTMLIMIIAVGESSGLRKDHPSSVIISSKQMDANNISTWYRNNGSFNRNPSTGNSGFEWPKGSGKFARYASGLWIGAKVGADTLIAIAEYDYEYLPGYIDAGGNPQGKDDSLYRIYIINKNETNAYDYIHWPYEQGAYKGSDGKPFMMGDQTMFYSYTDGYPQAHGNNGGSTAPLKVQILQTNWCFVKKAGVLNNVIFTEYRLINRGNMPWTDCYVVNWTDDDIGSASDDAVGCDTNLNLTYTYNFDNSDPDYGLSPPAAGFVVLRGPLVESPDDTAIFFDPPGSAYQVIKPGHRISGMTSSNMIRNADPSLGDPSNYRETYLVLQGFRRNGTPWVNPLTGQVTKFAFSGDPESGSGWIESNGTNNRFLQSMGPLAVNPGDTQSIVIAQVIARGSDNRNSVTLLKSISGITSNLFNQNFDVSIEPRFPRASFHAPGNGRIFLSWDDSCERVTYANKLTGGVYNFQGYDIYRIRPNTVTPSKSDTILIKTFDKIDGIRDIRDSIYLDEYQSITYGVVQKGSDNGISRSIELSKDTVSGGAFINGSEYKFSVTAYYYDPSGGLYTLPKVLSASPGENLVRVIPQGTVPEANVPQTAGDTLDTDQKDLAVAPIVISPLELTDAKYTSVFGGTVNNPAFTLLRYFNGMTDTLFRNIADFSGTQDSAKEADGIMFVHRRISDSGIVTDPENQYTAYPRSNEYGWTYEPSGNKWFEGPDTTAVKTAKMVTGRQYQSRSIGMSFPTIGTFRNSVSRVKANGKFFTPVSGQNAILTGGPLRKIRIVFGQSSKSYRYVPADTNLTNTPYADMADVPFSVFAVDELDSTGGTPRQLNTAFLDRDNNSIWDPDTSLLGNYHFTYILASDYDPVPNQAYTGKNPGIGSPTLGFPAMDVMYAWHPRAKKTSGGSAMKFTEVDVLTVWPYRITKPEFVPGYPLRYTWEVKGTSISSSNITSAEIASINVFPNPYFATSELEYDSGGEKFIYFSNLPLRSTIYIYTLDGVPVKKIIRDSSDPNSSLQNWDLKNSDGSYVASGMYIIYIDCGSAGAKTLKAAVFMRN